MFKNSVAFGKKSWAFIFLVLLSTFLTANPLCTFAAAVFLVLAVKLLYRRNEPPVFLIGMLLQWLQVTVKVHYSNYYGLPLHKVVEFPEHIYEAYFLSLLSLLVISFGIWVILSRVQPLEKEDYEMVATRYNTRRLCVIYLFAIVAHPFIIRFGQASGGFHQFFQNFADIKWSLLFLFYIITDLRKEYKGLFYFIVFVEVVLSFSGFFSNFKEYFILVAAGYLMLHQRMKAFQFFWLGVLGFLAFNIFVVWQHVKPEYRRFLNKGEATQNVKVGTMEAFDKLTSLVGKMDSTGYREGLESLINRASYIDFFSASMSHVPKSQAHEDGKLWKDAIIHIFTPRMLFPDKPVIDDSKLTSKYTGLELAGAEQGTSISLGYAGESYVDFGRWVMFIPLFLMGLVIGLIYRYLLTNTFHVFWGLALLTPLLFHLNIFEMALIKLVGGLISYFLVLLVLIKTRFIHKLDSLIRLHDDEARKPDFPEALPVGL